ncbi:MAG: hypothetical protein K1X89_10525 [Myxococcaceae bacterium]|nr:hypothetical protein [Myxococcaceae bacterium]
MAAELVAAETDLEQGHELTRVAAARGLHFNATLVEMLDEHFSHRTERRGCGYTQATRHLAVLVNEPQEAAHKLFPRWARSAGPQAHGGAPRLLHLEMLAVLDGLELEESRLLAGIVADLLAPRECGPRALPVWREPLKIGTCPLAEKYFLEIADGFVRRKGRANVLVTDDGEPVMLEKVGLGDDHSCISVTTLELNGVRLPPGCLFGVSPGERTALRANRTLPGSVIPVRACGGFRFLRLTTLAVSPENRARAFSAHFKAQLDAGLYAPGLATVAQLARVARDQL